MTSPYFFPYDNRIAIKTGRAYALLRAVRGFLLSPTFMLLPTLVACIFSILGEQYTMTALIINAQFFALTLFLCDDFAATMMPFLAVMCQGATLFNSWSTIVPYIIPWGIAPACALVFHLTVYRKPLRNGLSLWGLVATGTAILLSGLGTTDKLSPFASAETVFYYFGLSLGMLLLYFLFSSNYKRLKDYDVYENFLWQLLFSSLICSLIILRTLLAFEGEFDFVDFRNKTLFRNSLANIMIMGLPAPFYFAGKKGLPFAGKLLSFGLGLLIYLSLCLTTSRTAIVFGSLLFLLCLIYYFRRGDGRLARLVNLLVLLATLTASLSLLPHLLDILRLEKILAFFKGLPKSLLELDKGEPRMRLFFRAAEDFLAHPIFGVGLLSQRNADIYKALEGCIYWYHMYFPQIFGSLGLFGTAAYTLLLGIRARLMTFCPDNRARAVSLTALSLFLYSMTDPGEFMPIPFGMMATLAFVLLERHMEAHPESLAQKNQKNTKNYRQEQKNMIE
ncbi:MAG: O-antigen ligase family protein [Clostridia bacterium]|nr:O-antigen ligase family protein [Clostridia bacterium]